jgi:hypothetical protein
MAKPSLSYYRSQIIAFGGEIFDLRHSNVFVVKRHHVSVLKNLSR